jgi:hypothetical protein
MAAPAPKEAPKDIKDIKGNADAKEVARVKRDQVKNELDALKTQVRIDKANTEFKERKNTSLAHYHGKLGVLQKQLEPFTKKINKNEDSHHAKLLKKTDAGEEDKEGADLHAELVAIDEAIVKEKTEKHNLNSVEDALGFAAKPFVIAGTFVSDTLGPGFNQGFQWLNTTVFKPIGDTFKSMPGAAKDMLAKLFDFVGFKKGAEWLKPKAKTPEQQAEEKTKQDYKVIKDSLEGAPFGVALEPLEEPLKPETKELVDKFNTHVNGKAIKDPSAKDYFLQVVAKLKTAPKEKYAFKEFVDAAQSIEFKTTADSGAKFESEKKFKSLKDDCDLFGITLKKLDAETPEDVLEKLDFLEKKIVPRIKAKPGMTDDPLLAIRKKLKNPEDATTKKITATLDELKLAGEEVIRA